MSVSKWAYDSAKCDGGYCIGDCDKCLKAEDVTYCICNCVFKKCDRHYSNAPKDRTVMTDFLFNTDVCPMKIRGRGCETQKD